jgi:hypothetical protein
MLPKIIFKYSHVYSQNWQSWFQLYGKSDRKFSHEDIQEYVKKVEVEWEKLEKIVLHELGKTVKLKWKEREIICYVVGDCRPFSDPLTLPIYDDTSLFIDVLIHELVHRLFSQDNNYEEAEKSWGYFDDKYKNETFLTRIHIPLNATLEHIYRKILDTKRLDRDIKRSSFRIDYAKAWENVAKDGYKNIIKKFITFRK